MACFLVPAGEAIVATAVQKVVQRRESAAAEDGQQATQKTRGKWSRRLRWLNTMLWGGSLLLALEHVWHGEVVPWPPFLTAMDKPGEVGPMLREMATYGAAMAAAVTVIWGLMVVVAELTTKARDLPDTEATAAGGGA